MRFFDKKLSRCINYFKVTIVILVAIWFVISIYMGYHIKREMRQEKLLSDSYPIQ